LHARLSLEVPHGLPPNLTAVATVRVRTITPSPHERLQAPHEPQAFCSQSVGQASLLQLRVSARCAQETPPYATLVSMARLRDCAPVPHVSEHAVHAVQVDSWQSIGHSEALQLRESETAVHATPP
jgi:hypothetical protein